MSDDTQPEPDAIDEFLKKFASMSPEERQRRMQVLGQVEEAAMRHAAQHPEHDLLKPSDEDIFAQLDFTITDGVVRVEEVGTNRQVDRPDVAAAGLSFISQALEGAGGAIEIVGPVRFEPPPEDSTDSLIDYDEHLPD